MIKMYNVGEVIKHRVLGEGVIVDVIPREDGVPLLFIIFKSDPKVRRRFSVLSIRDYLV